ncbi:hypothetical protein H6G89_22545 [Oscillatoria sp. FACHB-1407]|uniref:hypothetical protein n=1 Tax=Oscillatoria sp. FACHB-1407 TaxID=2692847 RepID=UPI0016838D6D|nr:hypothetical protein [Oscillatoria sp. FACHB-1407]MBD2463785.1 hypothetical protein [Oscillatoria sp. FACHB-1407]
MYKTSKLFLNIVLIVCLVVGFWVIGIQRTNAQIPSLRPIQEATNRFNQTIDNFNNTINEYRQRIDEYEGKIDAYDQRVTTTINSIEGRVQDEIDGISGRVEDEITGVRSEIDSSIEEIEGRIVRTISSLGWGLLIGDSVVSAIASGVATWWVTRRLRRTIRTQLDEINTTFKEGVNTAMSRGEQAAQTVTDNLSQSNALAMIQGLQAENREILQLLRDLKNS